MKSTEAVKPVKDAQIGHFRTKVMEVVEPLLRSAGHEKLQQAFSVGSKMKELLDGAQALAVRFLDLNPYAEEAAEPSRSYDYDNSTLPTLQDQISKQLTAFGLSNVQQILIRSESAGTEDTDGLMAIPFLTDLGAVFGIEDPLGTGYGPLGEKVLEKVAATRTFYNDREGELGSGHVRLHADVKERLLALETPKQGFYDYEDKHSGQPEEGKIRFHVLPVSMGASLAGYGPRNARVTALLSNRLPLGFVQIACLLLGWPERLTAYEQRMVDCSGDQYNWDAAGTWADCPRFWFYDVRLEFDAYGAGGAGVDSGSPVASLGV